MSKNYTLTLLFVFYFTLSSFAQKETNNWYFGTLAGLNFNSGSPVPILNGALNTSEGCSSISDNNGNLLFYTDGVTVWDKNNQPMPNGDSLDGDVSSTQSALIVQQPGQPGIFYIFTTAADGGINGFRYSIVDMALNGGNGDVTAAKNVLIMDSSTEKVSAVRHPGNGIWVLAHRWGSDAFYDYDLTSYGISISPVISHVGTVHNTSKIQNAYGQMKFAPGGKKVGLAIGYQNLFEVFDFDDITGVVSNPITIPEIDHCYGLEFSPGGSLLYVTHYDPVNDYYFLDQYNLDAGNASAINASQVNLGVSYDGTVPFRALQIASDGKIYVAKGFTGLLGVINSPDSLGTACNYSDNSVSLGGNTGGLGLPEFVQSYFLQNVPPLADMGTRDTSTCGQNCISFSDLSINSPTSWKWLFHGANPDTSSLQNPQQVCYNTDGNYNVTLIVSNAFGSDTITRSNLVHVSAGVVAGVVTAVRDTVCLGTPGHLSVAGNSTTVQWQSSVTNSGFKNIAGADSIKLIDTLSLTTFYRTYVTNGFCSDTSAPFRIVVANNPKAIYTDTANGLIVNFSSDSSSLDVTHYKWDFGDSTESTEANPVHTYGKPGHYYVCLTVYNGSNCSYTFCRYRDFIIIGVNDISAGNNISIYPQPFTDNLYLDNTQMENIKSVEVFNLLGEINRKNSFNGFINYPLKLNLSDLTSGIYFIRVITNEGSYAQKIIKE